MSFKPRWYQQEAVDSIFDYFKAKTGNPICALPTGTGKSVVWAQFAYTASYYYPGTRILMLTHRKELIEQNAAKLQAVWPQAPVGIYSAGVGRKEWGKPITCASIQSIAPVIDKFTAFDLLVIDECHLVPHKEETQYRKGIDAMYQKNPALKVIGMTATSYRQGLGDLINGGIFTDYCYDLTGKDAFNRLIAEGFLCRLVPKQTALELSLEGVATRNGDFIEAELQKAVDKESVTRAAIEESIALGSDRKRWLVFGTGVQHAENIADMLKARGIKVYVITGKTAKHEREQIIAEFGSDAPETMAVVNNNVLTTGFDCPRIDLIVMLRPTQSAALHVQMLGRGTRIAEGKSDCLVLDFARNTRRLGPINDPILPHKKRDKEEGGKVPVKVCGQCGAYNSTRATICAECGYIFPPAECKLKTTAGTDELIAGSAPSIPEIVRMQVTGVVYGVHRKQGRPPMLRVSYMCGMREFSEYIHFEIPGLPRHNAAMWWNRRSVAKIPDTAQEALVASQFLPKPQYVNIHINTKHPRVVSCEF